MDLAHLIYRLAKDETLVRQFLQSPEETLNKLEMRLDQDAISAVVAVLQHHAEHQGLSGSTASPGGIDWTRGYRPRQPLTS